MHVTRSAGSAVVGIAGFALAIAVLFVMTSAVYAPIHYWDAGRAGYVARRLLSWVAFALVVGPALAVLTGVPFAAARRWGTSAALALLIAMVLGGLVADRFVWYLSYINDCTLRHPFPYGAADCSG